jgi:hypothetical protein
MTDKIFETESGALCLGSLNTAYVIIQARLCGCQSDTFISSVFLTMHKYICVCVIQIAFMFMNPM